MSSNVLEVKNLSKKFTLDAGFFARQDKFVYAVNDVSFSIERNKTFGLVGESGCGKTTTAKLIVKMYNSDFGDIVFNDFTDNKVQSINVNNLSRSELKNYREKVKYIFQDPSRSLNPRLNVYEILTSGYKYSKNWPGKKIAIEECSSLLEEVGLNAKDLYRYPSAFSGGQRQRISIARGLLMKPQILICDEVVSALDVSIQGQILNLLSDIKQKRNLSYVFIAHDLRVSCYFCDDIGVMYRGALVEQAPAKDFYKTAIHPYSKLLFAGAQGSSLQQTGEVKSALETIKGCPYAHRCPYATEKCSNQMPDWKKVDDKHFVRCFNF